MSSKDSKELERKESERKEAKAEADRKEAEAVKGAKLLKLLMS